MQDRIVRTLLQLNNRAVHVCTHADNLDMYQVVILIFHFVLRLETETGKFIFIVSLCSLRLAQGPPLLWARTWARICTLQVCWFMRSIS